MIAAGSIVQRALSGFQRIMDELGRPATLRPPERAGGVYDPETGATTDPQPDGPGRPLRVVLTERQLQDQAGLFVATRVALVPAFGTDRDPIPSGSILDVDAVDGGAAERFVTGAPRLREVAGVPIMARVPLSSMGLAP